MSIVVQHSTPPPAGLAAAVGQSLSGSKQAAQDEERLRFLLGARERRREVDINAALRLRGQDIEQQQYQQNLARQNAAQQSLLANQEANRQAQLYSQQMREEYDMAQQQQEQMFQYAVDSAKSVDEQVQDTVKASQQMKLNPEGQRILNEMMGKLRDIREYQGGTRPGVYSSLLNQWLDKYNSIGIDAYEVQEPSAAEKVYNNLVPLQGQQIQPGQPLPPGTYRSLKGVRNGVESWETITIPEPVSPTFAQDVKKNTSPAPDGGFFMRQPDGKFVYVPPKPPEKPDKPPQAKPLNDIDFFREAKQIFIDEHQLSQDPTSKTKKPFVLDIDKVWELADKLKNRPGATASSAGVQGTTAAPPAQSPADTEGPLIPLFGGSSVSGIGAGLAGPVGDILDQVGFDSMMGSKSAVLDLRGLNEEQAVAAAMEAPPGSRVIDNEGNIWVK